MQSGALQPMATKPWSSLPTPYASTFMALPAWPIYMPSYMPRLHTQPPFIQAQFEELARQHQDTEARELEVQCMPGTHNLNAVRDARIRSATSVRGSKLTRGKEQGPRRASSQLAPQQSQTPSGAPPSGSKSSVLAPPPASSQDGASQNVEAMVQDLVKTSLIQLGVIPQETPDQSQPQSDTVDPEPPQRPGTSSKTSPLRC